MRQDANEGPDLAGRSCRWSSLKPKSVRPDRVARCALNSRRFARRAETVLADQVSRTPSPPARPLAEFAMAQRPAPFAPQAPHLAGPSYLPSEISKKFVAYVRLEDEPQPPTSASYRHTRSRAGRQEQTVSGRSVSTCPNPQAEPLRSFGFAKAGTRLVSTRACC